jgi:membrane dipeptidase
MVNMKPICELLGISEDELEEGLSLHRESIIVDNAKMGVEPWSSQQIAKLEELVAQGKDYDHIYEEIWRQRLSEMSQTSHPTHMKYVEQVRKSGVTSVSLTQHTDSMNASLKSIARLRGAAPFDVMSDILIRFNRVDDIYKAKKENKLAVMLDFQNTISLGMNVNNLDLFYGLGVRQIQLTYNLRTYAADGCTERTDAGISHFGVALIERMNKLGIIVDTGHVGEQSTIEAAEISSDPIAISHSACKSVYNHDRCKSDEAIKAVAERGGVFGLVSIPYFLAHLTGKADRYGEVRGGKSGTLKDWLDHIDYAVDLVGVDHVGVGSDIKERPGCPDLWGEVMTEDRRLETDGKKPTWSGWRPEHPFDFTPSSETGLFPSPEKLLSWSNWPYKTVGLLSRGYSENEVKKIIGGNWLRLYSKVIG